MADFPKGGILVFLEEREDKLSNITLETVGGAHRLAQKAGCGVTGILMGSKIHEAAKISKKLNINTLLIADDSAFGSYGTMAYANAMERVLEKTEPQLVLFGSTSISVGIAAILSAKLEKGFVSDCIDIDYDGEGFSLIRPDASGSVRQSLGGKPGETVIATVRPGTFTEEKSQVRPTEVVELKKGIDYDSLEDQTIFVTNTILEKKQNSDISKSKILVSGGRGVGGPGGFEQLRLLAELLGGEVACSRACIEAGWADASMQVGQTGKTVRPELYIACGISGAIQHVTGMKDSELIIAINKNPAAPIFDVADLGIVGNLENILPVLIKSLQEKKGDTNAI